MSLRKTCAAALVLLLMPLMPACSTTRSTTRSASGGDAEVSSETLSSENQRLAKALKSSDWSVRTQAIADLRDKGPAAVEALPALIHALSDKHRLVRLWATETLGGLGPAAQTSAGELTRFLEKESDPGVRAAAAKALAQIEGPHGIPALIRALGDKDLGVRRSAAFSLGEMGSAAQEAIPTLIRVVQSDDDLGAQELAIRALGKIGPAAAPAVPALIEILKGKDSSRRFLRLAAIRTLGQIGPAAAQAVGAIRESMELDPNSGGLVKETLEHIEGEKKQ